MDMIYPVGSYYITESSDLNTAAKMATRFGGTWAQLDAGRFLEAVTSGAGSNKNAGLPNITGRLTRNGSSGDYGMLWREQNNYQIKSSGGIVATRIYGGTINGGAAAVGGYELSLDASKGGSTLYGASDTVQPKSRTVYIYRRTALAGGGIELVISLLNSILEGGRKYVKI